MSCVYWVYVWNFRSLSCRQAQVVVSRSPTSLVLKLGYWRLYVSQQDYIKPTNRPRKYVAGSCRFFKSCTGAWIFIMLIVEDIEFENRNNVLLN